ncbi:hypothetical protein KC19_3G178900 [Ceratodon purpureus]|uniref:Uncharacterized protein n=1 Tax=Ceratodon purpureus TaxID=3225 RepID=A0A8T0IM25_CERPU|nr:hypothetical protein KC19_3G178900 [Ceratodon purpureus]
MSMIPWLRSLCHLVMALLLLFNCHCISKPQIVTKNLKPLILPKPKKIETQRFIQILKSEAEIKKKLKVQRIYKKKNQETQKLTKYYFLEGRKKESKELGDRPTRNLQKPNKNPPK